MPGLSSTGEAQLLNALLTGSYISLHITDPGDTGANEVTTSPYVRQAMVFTMSGNNPTIAANSAAIQFPTATSLWGTITYFGVWSAATAGTFRGAWPVTVPKTIAAEDTARWDVGTLKIGTDEIF